MKEKYVIGYMRPATEGRGADTSHSMVPANVTVTSIALGIRDLGVDSEIANALTRIDESARELASRTVDAITVGGIAPVASRGYGFDKKIIERIAKVTSIPATTGITSIVNAINVLGAKKVILVTPYRDNINRNIAKFLEDSGIKIVGIQTANVPFQDYTKLPRSLSYELALKGKADAPDADCIFISCSAWPASENIDPVEKETDLPVIGVTEAGVWGALRLIGLKAAISGHGRLLRDY